MIFGYRFWRRRGVLASVVTSVCLCLFYIRLPDPSYPVTRSELQGELPAQLQSGVPGEKEELPLLYTHKESSLGRTRQVQNCGKQQADIGPESRCSPWARPPPGIGDPLPPGQAPPAPPGALQQVARDPSWNWISRRITRMWSGWLEAARNLNLTNPKIYRIKRKVKKIGVVPGLLTTTQFGSIANIAKGGPQGDLIQWADLIAGLIILGHHIILHKQPKLDKRILSDPIASGCEDREVDLMFIDILGVKGMGGANKARFKSKLRVLDIYGTDTMHNNPKYSQKHGYNNPVGGLDLNLKQFYTFYPHSPDNSFLGFVVSRGAPREETEMSIPKDNIGVLYGKEAKYFQKMGRYIKHLQGYMEIHTTVSDWEGQLPPGVVNHGIITPEEYHILLRRAKYFVGVGDPIEGTGVLEALHQGCIYLNPKFVGGRQFKGKPTSRNLSSQVPYLEEYVGPPRVYSLDVNNLSEVDKVINATKHTKLNGMIPYEFTMEGFLERLNAYIENQQIHNSQKNTSDVWPSLDHLTTIVGRQGESCTQTCRINNMVCDPVFFPHVNREFNKSRLELQCSIIEVEEDVYHPSHDVTLETCTKQGSEKLFSCEGGKQVLRRVCPCRDVIKGQVALSPGCI